MNPIKSSVANLKEKNYDEKEIVENLPSSPLLTVSTRAHYGTDSIYPLSVSPTPRGGLRPPLEPVSESAEHLSPLSVPRTDDCVTENNLTVDLFDDNDPNVNSDVVSDGKEPSKAKRKLDWNKSDKNNIVSDKVNDNKDLKSVSPPLVNGCDANAKNNRNVIDFQGLLNAVPDAEKIDLLNPQNDKLATEESRRNKKSEKRAKSSNSIVLVPALRTEHLSLRQRKNSGKTVQNETPKSEENKVVITKQEKTQSSNSSPKFKPTSANASEKSVAKSSMSIINPKPAASKELVSDESGKSGFKGKERQKATAFVKSFNFKTAKEFIEARKNKEINKSSRDSQTAEVPKQEETPICDSQESTNATAKVNDDLSPLPAATTIESVSFEKQNAINFSSKNEDFETPTSLSLFVPEQDEAVTITINLNNSNEDDSTKFENSNKSESVAEKSKKQKMSSRAVEATSRLYKSCNESTTKTESKKNSKNLKLNTKKIVSAKNSSKKSPDQSNKTSGKTSKSTKVLSADAKKKRKVNNSGGLNLKDQISDRKTKSANNNSRLPVREDQVTVQSPLECLSEKSNPLSTKDNTFVKVPSDVISDKNDNTTSPNMSNDINKADVKSVDNSDEQLGIIDTNDATINKATTVVESSSTPSNLKDDGVQAKHYHKPQVQTPIIVEAFPSLDESILLERVGQTKQATVIANRARSAFERKKKSRFSASALRQQAAKKTNKKKQKDDAFADLTDSPARSKSAGLAVEKRGKNLKKLGKKGRKALYESEGKEADILDDVDLANHALISGLSWQIRVPKNESGDHLIMKSELSAIPGEASQFLHANDLPNAVKMGGLSPIAEANSLRSSAEENQVIESNSNNSNNIVSGLKDCKCEYVDSSSAHRPESSLSILSLNVSPTNDNARKTNKNSPLSLKETAWESQHNIVNESKTEVLLNVCQIESPELVRNTPLLRSNTFSSETNDSDVEVVANSEFASETDSFSDDIDPEEELESYLRMLQGRSEMDAKILKRPKSSSWSDTSPNSTLNQSTLSSNSTLKGSGDADVDDRVLSPSALPIQVIDSQSLSNGLDSSDKRAKPVQQIIWSAQSPFVPRKDLDLNKDNSGENFQFDLDHGSPFPHHSDSLIISDNDSEHEMFEHMRRTLHQESDESDVLRSESECSIHLGQLIVTH